MKYIPDRGEEFMGSNPSAERAYRITLGVSGADVTAAVGANNLFAVAANTLVTKVLARIRTGWTTSVTITIGDDDADEYFASADLAPQTAVSTGIMKNSLEAAQDADYGKQYTADATITATIAGATPAAGLMDIIVFAVPPQS